MPFLKLPLELNKINFHKAMKMILIQTPRLFTCVFFSLRSAAPYLSHSSIPLRRKAFTTKLSPETRRHVTDQQLYTSMCFIVSLSFMAEHSNKKTICSHLRGFLCVYTLYIIIKRDTRHSLVLLTLGIETYVDCDARRVSYRASTEVCPSSRLFPGSIKVLRNPTGESSR